MQNTNSIDTRISWQTFSVAPHRMMMFGGGVQLIVTLLYWMLELSGRLHGSSLLPATVIPSSWAHGYLLLYATFPFYFFGFLMTTYPRWMRGPLVARERYIPSFLLMTGGSVLTYIGLFTNSAVLGVAILLHAAGWIIGVIELYSVFRRCSGSKSHEYYLNVYLALGAFGMTLFGGGVLLGQSTWLPIALTLGLWAFAVPVLLTVAHRMLPFFSSSVLQPYTVFKPDWMLPILPVLLAGHILCDSFGLSQWRFIFDAPLASGGLYLSYRWGLRRSFQVRLLAVLHMAFIWFGIGMALSTIDSLLLLTDSGVSLGRAPLHALAIGLIAGMTIGMASRVTLGHSGRPLEAGTLVWLACWGIQLAALLRVVSELPIGGHATELQWLAGLVWLGSVGPWALKFLPMYVRPRVDGNPG